MEKLPIVTGFRRERIMKMRRKIIALLFLCLTILIPVPGAVAAEKADYVFKNGAVYTIESKNPIAEAVAVTGKKISYVGKNNGVDAFIGKNTQVIDLKGKMLIPGFVDSHIHPTMAFLAAGADLQSDSMVEVLARTKAWATAHPDAKLIRGFGWRYTMFSSAGPIKVKEILDKQFPDRPVLLVAIDGLSALANSKALEIAGINAKSPDPAPGISFFQRDPKTNEPTGWVVEKLAEQEILAKLDPLTPAAVIAAMAEEMPRIAATGITSIFDAGVAVMPTETAFEGYQRLEKENKLPVRIVGSFYWNTPTITDPVDQLQALRKKFSSELVQVRTLKITLDGGEAQHTAVMLQPYADWPNFLGEYALDKKLVSVHPESAILKRHGVPALGHMPTARSNYYTLLIN
jgi:predicted amidohydrolase YtcJ